MSYDKTLEVGVRFFQVVAVVGAAVSAINENTSSFLWALQAAMWSQFYLMESRK